MREIFGLMALLQLMQMNCWVESKMEDVFSSTAELANLHSVEKELLQYIKEYKKELEESIKKIKSSDDLSLPVIHPKFEGLVDGLPELSEVEGGGNGIFLLQEVYQLNSSLLSEGKVRLNEEEYSAKHSLSNADIEFVAKLAYNRGFYDRAVEWFTLAASKPMHKKEKLRVTKLLATTIKKHDLVLDRKGSEGSSRSETWRTNTLPFDPILRKKKKFKKTAAKQQTDQESKDWENFNRLCRGEYKEDKSNKDLKSYYLHYQNPYLMLGPWKLDVQSNFPFIAVFRGFLYDEEMNHYTDYAMNKLFRSEYGGSVSQGGTIKGVQRTSKQAWLHEHDFPDTTDNNTHWSIGGIKPN